MSRPHPTDPGYLSAYSAAWTKDVEALQGYFAPDGVYTDVAMGATYAGRSEIARFHRFMLTFAPDSVIEFHDGHADGGRFVAEWTWSGSFAGPLRLRNGALVDATGSAFSVPGIAACRYGEDGLLTGHRDFWDLATVLDQAKVPIG